MRPLVELLIGYVALFPIATAGVWVAGGLLFRLLDESNDAALPADGWPGVTVLVSAFNEEKVIGTCVRALLAVDYPELEVLVLDDGSSDGTAVAATAAGAGDPRMEVVRDAVNRGKAERLNLGFHRARHDLILVTDADTHLDPAAVKLLVARISRSPLIVAVAGAPKVTNRRNVLNAMQILEASSIIGLIRRTQALSGRVAVVAGVLGLFRREPVLAVGGYDGRMATEDIDLTWRLLLAGWHTTFEPAALVGMEVPSTLDGLWAQRRRWARGQGEVLRTQLRMVARWRNRRVWPLGFEAVASLVWVIAFAFGLAAAIIGFVVGSRPSILHYGFAWGIAVAVVATLQLAFALGIDARYDRRAALAFLLGPIYPIAFWLVSGVAALRAEIPALFHGPREHRVVWDIQRH
jgi:biofilm PGA synthesis N-glycosyltransferase PgaC